jgi:hypothetical protein
MIRQPENSGGALVEGHGNVMGKRPRRPCFLQWLLARTRGEIPQIACKHWAKCDFSGLKTRVG